MKQCPLQCFTLPLDVWVSEHVSACLRKCLPVSLCIIISSIPQQNKISVSGGVERNVQCISHVVRCTILQEKQLRMCFHLFQYSGHYPPSTVFALCFQSILTLLTIILLSPHIFPLLLSLAQS